MKENTNPDAIPKIIYENIEIVEKGIKDIAGEE